MSETTNVSEAEIKRRQRRPSKRRRRSREPAIPKGNNFRKFRAAAPLEQRPYMTRAELLVTVPLR